MPNTREMRDYYEVLGIERTASQPDIKSAYRALARQFHPDVNKDPSAEARFKEINEAYEVLSSDEKRQVYDRFGHAGLSGAGAQAGPGAGAFTDIFDMFFGGGGQRASANSPERGDDLRIDVEITLEEAAAGVERSLSIQRLEACDVCEGTGARPGSRVETCGTCRGQGAVRHTQNTLLGAFQTTVTCPKCGGEGRVLSNPCPQCHGGARIRKTRDKSVRIPPGVNSGAKVRVSGDGDVGVRGGPPGDLYVVVYVRPHEIFERRNNDLYCEVGVSFVKAALGGPITVPTLGEEVAYTLPEGTQSGASFKLRDLGVPDVRGHGRGDLHFIVKILVPTRLNAEQKAMLDQFSQSLGEHQQGHGGKGFFGKLFGGER